MPFVFPPPSQVSLPIANETTRFPVRRVYCVAANYAQHAIEVGGDGREPPSFFAKPSDVLVSGNTDIKYPSRTTKLQHEVELVVALSKGGKDIPVDRALECVYGYAVGIDLTRRDLQAQAKENGKPWEMSKGFDQSAPISPVFPVGQSGHVAKGRIWLAVNGNVMQDGDLGQMTWNVAEVIANLSSYVELAAGDLIFTGTPAGVSTVVQGDKLECGIEGLGDLSVKIV